MVNNQQSVSDFILDNFTEDVDELLEEEEADDGESAHQPNVDSTLMVLVTMLPTYT
jgi:hypothetical protein